jgi:hypothetical protein
MEIVYETVIWIIKVIAPNTDNSVEFDPTNGERPLEATLQARD